MVSRIKVDKFLILVLFLAFVLAFGIRVSLICITPGAAPYSTMAFQIGEAARNLVEGRGYVLDREYLGTIQNLRAETGKPLDIQDVAPPDDEQFTPYYVLPPGASILQAVTYWTFGEYRFIYVRVVQAIIDSFGCLIMFLIGRELFNRRIGLISAFLYATYLPIAYLSTWPLHDALMPFLTLVSLYFFIKGVQRRAMKFYVLSAVFVGISCYFQGSTLLLPLFFGLGLFIHNLRESSFREHIANVAKVTAVMMAVLVLVISPWVARNYHVTGAIFAGTRAGIWAGIWQGWGEFADNPVGAKQSDEDTMRIAKQELGVEKLDFGPEYDAVFRKKVIDTIKEHPVWCLSAVARRIPRTIVNFSELGINTLPIMREDSGILLAYLYRDAPVIGYMGAISGLIAGIKDGTFWGTAKSHPYGFLYFGLVGLFAFVPALLSIIGIWAMRKNWRSLILVATVPIYFSMLHMVLWTSGASKSIMPASLGYIIFSAVALYYIYGRIKGIRGEVVELNTPLN